MKLENRLKDIQIALKLADWFSTEEQVDYNADLSLGYLFVNGKIDFLLDRIYRINWILFSRLSGHRPIGSMARRDESLESDSYKKILKIL